MTDNATPDRVRHFIFYITNDCNLTCKHCLFSSGSNKKRLDLDLYREAIDSLSEDEHFSHSEIGFSGGEFFIHPDWREILLYARNKGFRCGIVTNGTLLSNEDLGLLSDPGVRLAISLDGFAASHDGIRG